MKTNVKEVRWAWDNPDVQDLLLKYYRDWLFNTPETAERIVAQVLSTTPVEPPGDILDVGCGLGHHAIAFAKRGFRVFAFDPGDRYVGIARENITGSGLDIDIRRMRCSELAETGRFSLAWAGGYCPGQLSPEEVAGDFRRIYTSLLPGGWFVSSVAGKAKVPPSEKMRNWGELDDCYILSEKWADETRFHEYCSFVYPDRNEVIKLIEVERMYGVNEIVPLLEEAGFRDITTSNSIADAGIPAREGKHFSFWCRR
ncbi:MAG: class I SAM-dependent methyltransferase [Desulfobacterales bacterium]|nr:class I SAM-dependent methyltransferase [Desulfobacterales bacterium]